MGCGDECSSILDDNWKYKDVWGLLPLLGEKVDVSVKITRFDNVVQCYKTFYAPNGGQAPLSPR